jgi:hypothetical protein
MAPQSPESQSHRQHLARTSRGRNFTQRGAPPASSDATSPPLPITQEEAALHTPATLARLARRQAQAQAHARYNTRAVPPSDEDEFEDTGGTFEGDNEEEDEEGVEEGVTSDLEDDEEEGAEEGIIEEGERFFLSLFSL